MADDQILEDEKKTVEQAKLTEAKYPRAELIQSAQAIFKVAPEVVAGALYGNGAEELTVAEVNRAINTFLKRKVK